nr:GvpC=gas vesicle protein {N-terminal} [Calothrix, Peptide Partial, 84 aa] [Calothrix]
MTPLMIRIRQEHRGIAEEVTQLFKDTQEFLSVTTAQRQAQAKEQAENLHQFHKDLEKDTEEFLTDTAKERMAKAKQQAEDLFQF